VDEKSQSWHFYYHLRPRSTRADQIPLLRLSYYNPDLIQLPPIQRFQTSFARPISLSVKVPPKVISAPQRMYQLAPGQQVLRSSAADWPGLPLLLLAGLAPPIGCGAWYWLWWYRHPDERRLARRRWSRAAKQAIRELQRIRGDRHGEQTSRHLIRYLRRRLNLPGLEMTAEDFRIQLRNAELGDLAAQATLELLRFCQQCRFAPPEVPRSRDLAGEAVALIRELETQSWGI
jgi:hypothetical protein